MSYTKINRIIFDDTSIASQSYISTETGNSENDGTTVFVDTDGDFEIRNQEVGKTIDLSLLFLGLIVGTNLP